MLQIIIPEREYFDDQRQEFIYSKKHTLLLEHSLISISKWESKWKKPFLANSNDRTIEESKDYIRCMSLSPTWDDSVYDDITNDEMKQIAEYIDDKMTATWFNDKNDPTQKNGKPGRNGQIITSELIYYWMISFNIPFECQKWHINRLLTLIRICQIKNTPAKKMKKKDLYARNRELNEARRRQLGTKG